MRAVSLFKYSTMYLRTLFKFGAIFNVNYLYKYFTTATLTKNYKYDKA